MKLIINKTGLFIGLMFAVNGYAQSLPDLINLALQENYQISILRNDAEIAANNNTAGNAGQLPTVDFDGVYSISSNNTRQQLADGTVREGNNAGSTSLTLSLLANWTLFDGFRVYARKEQLGYLQELGEQTAKFYIEQTIADLSSLYYETVYQKGLLDNYRQSLMISSYRMKYQDKRREVGSASGMEYHQALVDYQTDSINYLEQQMNLRSLEIQINKILNRDPDTEVMIADTSYTYMLKSSREELIDLAMENSQQLKQQELEALIAETEIRIQQSDRYPQVDIFGGVQYTRSTAEVGFINSNRNFGPTIGVSVNFNLYNGGNTAREIENATIQSASEQTGREGLANDINADIANLYQQYRSIQERKKLSQRNVEAAQKVYRIAEEQLKRGSINGYDFRTNQMMLLNAQLRLLEMESRQKNLEINIYRLIGQTTQNYM